MRYEALSREPDNLRVEKDRCQREMEQLAVQNYSAFIGSAEVTQGVKQVPNVGLVGVEALLREKERCFCRVFLGKMAKPVGNRAGSEICALEALLSKMWYYSLEQCLKV